MTISLSKLMAVADKAPDDGKFTSHKDLTEYLGLLDPPTVKRLLAIAKAGSNALPLLEALVFVFEQSPVASFAPKTTAKMASDIRKQYEALRASLEGVEL